MLKENSISPIIYQKILQSQQQLTNYLKYIRHKQPVPKIQLNNTLINDNQRRKENFNKVKKQSNQQVKLYIDNYLKLIRQILSLQSYLSKKIIKKLLQFLEQFPSMNFLYQVINCFGRDKKKISVNQIIIYSKANDDMIPLFQKIIEKIEYLKKQGQSKKLLELGHRIQHLKNLIDSTKNNVKQDAQHGKIFKTFQSDRVEKYILMEENINKAQKNFGEFSVNLLKNKQTFSNLNKAYFRIQNSTMKE